MCSVREKLRIVGRAAAFVLLAAAGFAARSATPPAEACAAATNGLPKFLGKIPSGAEAAYGFPEGTRRAALGRPVQLEAFEPTSLEQISRSGALEDKVRRYQTWFFPVLVGSETRAFLVVDRRSSADWEAVSLGYAPVAREWNEVVRAWPAERGFHPRLIAAFQARATFSMCRRSGTAISRRCGNPGEDGRQEPGLPAVGGGCGARPLAAGQIAATRALIKTGHARSH